MKRTAKTKEAASGSNGEAALTQQIDELAAVLRRHDLGEIEIEREGLRIRLRRGAVEVAHVATHAPIFAPAPSAPAPAVPAAAVPIASIPAPATPTPKAETGDGNVSYITSPFVGTFYRSPSPDTAPFVDVGTRVRKGQVICIVEAMKLMNEIEAEIDGVVVQCLVENGSAVEYGEPLFKIKQG